MKSLFFMGSYLRFLVLSFFVLTSFQLMAGDCEECEEELVDEACVVKFKKLNNYENSSVINPIERDFPYQHPSSHESSFYEYMTR